MDYITVGKIVKAQGIKGEIKIQPITDDSKRFLKLKVVYIASTPYQILSCRLDNTSVFLSLKNVLTRNDAEAIVGNDVMIDRVFATDLSDDRYFITDIIGCDIIGDDDKNLGKITAVDSYGAADVFTAIDNKEDIFRFPFLKVITTKVDIANKKFHVITSKLREVSVYED